jgi:DNA gyrase subunit A
MFAMAELGMSYDKPFKKSARIDGEAMGKYHPHSSSYGTLVNLATSWANREPLIDGQGNYGTTSDGPAAARYTECRPNQFADEVLLSQLDQRWLSYKDNYDGSLKEPVTLPARLPMLLLRDTAGIGVATACRHVSYNLAQVAKLSIAAVQSKSTLQPDKALAFVTQPDFAMGGQVVHDEGMRNAIVTGQGTIRLYAKSVFEPETYQIVVTELPQDVSPETVLNQTAAMLKDGRLDRKTLADVRDESDRSGTRVVWELSKQAWNSGLAPWVLNELHRYTDLQTTVSVNAVSVDPDGGGYSCRGVAQVANDWAQYRLDYETKRVTVLLADVQNRTELLTGQLIALANIVKVAKALVDGVELSDIGLGLTDVQIQSIESMPLRSLRSKNGDKLSAELIELGKQGKQYSQLLANDKAMRQYICDDIDKLARQFSSPMCTVQYEQPISFAEDLEVANKIKRAELEAKGAGFLHDHSADGEYLYARSTSRTSKVPCTQVPIDNQIGIAAVLSNGHGYWLPVDKIPLNTKDVLQLKQMLADYTKPFEPGTTVLWAEVLDRSKAKTLKRKLVITRADKKGKQTAKTITLDWVAQLTGRRKFAWLGGASSCTVIV